MRTLVILSASLVTACNADDGGAQGESSGFTTSATGGEDDGSSAGSAGTTGATSANDSSEGSDGSSSDGESSGTTGGDPPPSDDPLDPLPHGEDQWELLCARGHDDAIARAFCAGDSPPVVTSIPELLELIGLGFIPGNMSNGANGNPSFTFASHSTAIGTRFVNAINPRAFVFTPPVGGVTFPPSGIADPDLVMMAFSRGEPFVELVANDRTADELRFYLFRFVSECEEADDCNNADRFTPATESGFVEYSLYDDHDIRNTVLDCLQCHQPDGPDTQKVLRMQEFVEGWTHWYYANRPQNRETMEQFVAAHGGEQYGGIPGAFLTQQQLLENNAGSAPPTGLEQVLRNEGFITQPNEFPSQAILIERQNAGCMPSLDPTNSCSATWDALYTNAVQGNAMAVPYFDGHITDATKRDAATQAYVDFMNGVIGEDEAPDMSDVLLDEAFPYMSFEPAPGLDARGILTHMCSHCHNSSLDQTITRANFNVANLDSLPQTIKDEAIRRLQLPDDDIQRMPPLRFHTLSDDQIDMVIDELSP